MNLKQDIDKYLSMARQEAESREFRRKGRKRLFLFAIELGRKEKLTPLERSSYEKTYMTALILSGVAERDIPPSDFDRVADGSLDNWLELEPRIRAWLERAIGHDLDEADRPRGMSPERRRAFVECLSMLYGDEVSKNEIESLLNRLENPLDRA